MTKEVPRKRTTSENVPGGIVPKDAEFAAERVDTSLKVESEKDEEETKKPEGGA